MEQKLCTACKESKPLAFFNKNKNGKFGKHSICKECRAERSRFRYSNGDTYAIRLKKLYGLSVKEYDELYAEAEGQCQCCGIKEKELNKRLAVDHCHSSGKVRGLLCGKCNTALGQLDDSLDKISSLYSYLKERSQ